MHAFYCATPYLTIKLPAGRSWSLVCESGGTVYHQDHVWPPRICYLSPWSTLPQTTQSSHQEDSCFASAQRNSAESLLSSSAECNSYWVIIPQGTVERHGTWSCYTPEHCLCNTAIRHSPNTDEVEKLKEEVTRLVASLTSTHSRGRYIIAQQAPDKPLCWYHHRKCLRPDPSGDKCHRPTL